MEQEKKLPEPLADSFQVVPESYTKMATQVKRCYINMCHHILELDIAETKDFAVLNWVAGLAKEELSKEIVTVISLDQDGQILCMLRFSELALLDHETTFNVAPGEFGNRMPLMHSVHLKFEMVERVNKELGSRLKSVREPATISDVRFGG